MPFRGVATGQLGSPTGCASALGVAHEADGCVGRQAGSGEPDGGTGHIQEGSTLGSADHVGVQARGAEAFVVADGHGPSSAEGGLPEQALGVGTLGEGVGGGALVTAAAGAATVRDLLAGLVLGLDRVVDEQCVEG